MANLATKLKLAYNTPMSEQLINQIDLLVHPDYHLVDHSRPELKGRSSIPQKWDQRVQNLGSRDDAILLYYPGISIKSDTDLPFIIEPRWQEDPVQIETERQERYKELLGNRILFFNLWEIPQRKKLIQQLSARGFNYAQRNISIFVYGEYLEWCVESYKYYLGKALHIPDNKIQLLTDLSVHSFSTAITSEYALNNYLGS